MKTVFRISALLFLVLTLDARAGTTVGYHNREFYPGDNLFQTTLLPTPSDSLSAVLPKVPEGTTVSLWNSTLNAYGTTAQFLGGAWSINFALPVGTGAKLNTATRFTATFVGVVCNHDGSAWDVDTTLVPAPVFSDPAGLYLLGDKTPIKSAGNDVFINVLGREPLLGERFTRLDAQTQTYITSTCQGNGTWDILPILGISEAGIFHVVPEPASTALGLLGLLVLSLGSRGRVGT